MTEHRVPGRSVVTRRAIVDIVRPAVSGSYGVLGFAEPSLGKRILRRLGLVEPGIRVSLRDGIAIDLYLSVAYGLPVAEVARQADSAVRYALRRALGREIGRLTVHVGGLRFQPAGPPEGPGTKSAAPGPDVASNPPTPPGRPSGGAEPASGEAGGSMSDSTGRAPVSGPRR